ncbi:MAG: hypothetical protein ACTHQM_25520 [Thermoanaerobaculia bacterium]
MATMMCASLQRVIDELDQFISRAWAENAMMLADYVYERDRGFIEKARSYASQCDRGSLHALEEEMRGLSHYFGSYADEQQLQSLLDRLYVAWKDATLNSD